MILLFFLGKIEAQHLDSIRHLWEQNELGRAKELIDHYTDSTENAQGWFLKAKVYESISKDNKYKDLVADPKAVVFASLKYAYYYKEDFLQLIKDDSIAFKIYESYTNDGVSFFNAGTEKQDKEDYALALESFKKAADVRFFINFYQSLPPIDTINLLYSAKAAMYGEDEQKAAYYSKKIADAGISGTNFEPVYQWLLYYYMHNSYEEELVKYSALVEKLFPKSDYYLLNLIDFYRSLDDAYSVIKTFDNLFQRGFKKEEYHISFIKDLSNYAFRNHRARVDSSFLNYGDINTTPKQFLKDKLLHELKSFTKANPQNAEGKLLFGKYYINQAVDLQNEILYIKNAKQYALHKAGIAATIKKSNVYLQDIVDRSPKTKINLKIEAAQLLVSNFTALGMSKQARRYKSKLNLLSKAILTIVLFILSYLT